MEFYAVGTDPTEGLDKLERVAKDRSYPWKVATPGEGMLQEFNVRVQSTKVALDRDGVIVYRSGYGSGDEGTWRRVLEDLAAGS